MQLDAQPPFNLEERKGLKEAQHAAYSHPPLNPRSDLRLARGLPSGPSTAPRISASLEGSESTLERTNHLRLARGHRTPSSR